MSGLLCLLQHSGIFLRAREPLLDHCTQLHQVLGIESCHDVADYIEQIGS